MRVCDNYVCVVSLVHSSQEKVHAGWVLVAVDGHQVRTKRELAATLQRLALASAGTWFRGHPAKVDFDFATQAVTSAPASTGAKAAPAVAECVVELRNHVKHGYGAFYTVSVA
jgi:hypothetical protein